jgi:activator of 2-hydroxyglutaryl-CoA dehydratase
MPRPAFDAACEIGFPDLPSRCSSTSGEFVNGKRTQALLGVDFGTSSSKGALVSPTGELIATTTRHHAGRQLYESTTEITHALAARQRRAASTPKREVRDAHLSVS